MPAIERRDCGTPIERAEQADEPIKKRRLMHSPLIEPTSSGAESHTRVAHTCDRSNTEKKLKAIKKLAQKKQDAGRGPLAIDNPSDDLDPPPHELPPCMNLAVRDFFVFSKLNDCITCTYTGTHKYATIDPPPKWKLEQLLCARAHYEREHLRIEHSETMLYKLTQKIAKQYDIEFIFGRSWANRLKHRHRLD